MTLEDAPAAARQETDLVPESESCWAAGSVGLRMRVEAASRSRTTEFPDGPSRRRSDTRVCSWSALDGVPVAVMRGRAHLYEGLAADRAVFGVRVLGRLGAATLVVTNAAGAIDEAYRPGLLVPHLRPRISWGHRRSSGRTTMRSAHASRTWARPTTRASADRARTAGRLGLELGRVSTRRGSGRSSRRPPRFG